MTWFENHPNKFEKNSGASSLALNPDESGTWKVNVDVKT